MLVVKHTYCCLICHIFFDESKEGSLAKCYGHVSVLNVHISVPAMLRKLLCVFVSITQCVG